MAEPAGIDVSIEVDTTTVTVTSEEAVNVAIAPETTSVAISVVPASTIASAIGSTAYGSITATNIQTALEQLADQFYRGSTTPTGTNLGEGDLWYDTANEELRVYREISSGSFAWIALVAGGYATGETSLMDKLDGGFF
tara:strand:- start:198 stop:614 length:417 start_codon:yes stop_codon:yes gene_type:complete